MFLFTFFEFVQFMKKTTTMTLFLFHIKKKSFKKKIGNK